ncbi:serine protease [Brevundimonas sp.]|uniref:S1 family peptidase n=1 Tax=Brevundimonas sp. TaxID=1871086 RepID=UPI0028AC963E|nr:serine protease [Brevundimonas sp.]
MSLRTPAGARVMRPGAGLSSRRRANRTKSFNFEGCGALQIRPFLPGRVRNGNRRVSEQRRGAFKEIYLRSAGAVAYVAVQKQNGDDAIGTAFHIGDGVFLTARHVVDDVAIQEIATTKSAHLETEAGGRTMRPRLLPLLDGPHFAASDLDVAVFKVDLAGAALPAITLSQHTDYNLGENDMVLSDILIVGYPPVPFTTEPIQIAAEGQVNAVVRLRHSPVLHFVASATARGGFSGGPVLDIEGRAIGIVTEALSKDGAPVELGFLSLLSIEPGFDLAAKIYGLSLSGAYPGRYSDTLLAVRFANTSARSLNSLIYDAGVYVYDDDRDVFVEIDCADPVVTADAVKAMNTVTEMTRVDVSDGPDLYMPVHNPSAALLLEAGQSAVAVFVAAGYRIMASEQSEWQLAVHDPADG